MHTHAKLQLKGFNPNFINDFTKYLRSYIIKYEDYPLLIKLIRSYEFILRKNIVQFYSSLNTILLSKPENSLLVYLIFYELSSDSNFIEKLIESFSIYIQRYYPQINICKNYQLISFFEQYPRKTSGFHNIAKWYLQLKDGNEHFFCNECDSLLIPSFKKIDTYICSNPNCSNLSVYKYHNHCWNCWSTIDSEYNKQCINCGWYICNECGKCIKAKICTEKSHKKVVNNTQVKDFLNFPSLRDVSENLFEIYKSCVKKFRNQNTLNFFNNCEVDRGTKILGNDAELYKYIAMYGTHHISKLWLAFDSLNFDHYFNKNISIYDWGCGQGLGTLTFLEYIYKKQIKVNINNIILIEPSDCALEKAKSYINSLIQKVNLSSIPIKIICKNLDQLSYRDIENSTTTSTTYHILSNIIDIESFNLYNFGNLLKTLGGQNYFICTSPNYIKSQKRIDKLYEIISNNTRTKLLSETNTPISTDIYHMYKKKFAKHYVKRYQKIYVTN